MTAHLHKTFVEWCFRCDLAREEEAHAIAEQEADEARWAACPSHIWQERSSRFGQWAVCSSCGAEEDR